MEKALTLSVADVHSGDFPARRNCGTPLRLRVGSQASPTDLYLSSCSSNRIDEIAPHVCDSTSWLANSDDHESSPNPIPTDNSTTRI